MNLILKIQTPPPQTMVETRRSARSAAAPAGAADSPPPSPAKSPAKHHPAPRDGLRTSIDGIVYGTGSRPLLTGSKHGGKHYALQLALFGVVLGIFLGYMISVPPSGTAVNAGARVGRQLPLVAAWGSAWDAARRKVRPLTMYS